MRSRFGWVTLALLSLALLPSPLPAADEMKKPRPAGEKFSARPPLDFGILADVPETEPNDAPAQATLLDCGNRMRPAEIAVQAVRDTDWISFTANAGDVITFGTDADGPSPIGDTRISIVSDDGVTVLASDDDSGPEPGYSLLSVCAPYTGVYYGRNAAFSSQTGTYMAILTCAPSGAPNDQCAGAIHLPCGPIDLSGTTANVCADYALPETGCTGFLANGRDVVYKLNVLAGDSLYLDYAQSVADASIYIVTDCADPAGTCVAGEDSTLVGGHETLSHRFTADGTYYVILDSFSPGSGGPWTATGAFVCVPDRADTLAGVHADVDLVGPWGTERVGLNGAAILHATMRGLRDPDGSGVEIVPIELGALELTGHSVNAGPVTLRVRSQSAHPFQRGLGYIEEHTNATPGVLDLPPFAPAGTASAFLSNYLQLELPVLKLVLHNHDLVGLAGAIRSLPPAAGDSLQGGVFPVPLFEPDETPTPYAIAIPELTPSPLARTDTLANPRILVDVLGPLGLDTAVLKGTAVVRSKPGNLGDADGDGLEQAAIELVAMDMSGVSALYGPIHASLAAPTPHPLPATAGDVEENVNAEPARLDLPPFAPSGTAASYLDVFLRLTIGGTPYHNHVAKRLTATLTQFPPAAGEQYRNFVPTPLLDDNDAASTYQARRLFFMPFDVKPDSTQVDSFPASRLTMDVMGPWGLDQIVMYGSTVTKTDLGSVQDGDDDGREQMGTRLLDLAFTSQTGGVLGHIPGPVTLHMRDTLGLGEIEETANYTPGMLDLPPFAPVGSAAAQFFEVLFEMEIPGYPTLRNHKPSLLEATLDRVPVAFGDTYLGLGDNPLVDIAELPSGLTIVKLRLTPWTGGALAAPEAPPPATFAIRDLGPNPARGSAQVTLALPRAAQARVAAYDLNGRLVSTLWSGPMEAGVRTLTWNGRSDRGDRVPGGIYFIRFESGVQRATRRLAILR